MQFTVQLRESADVVDENCTARAEAALTVSPVRRDARRDRSTAVPIFARNSCQSLVAMASVYHPLIGGFNFIQMLVQL